MEATDYVIKRRLLTPEEEREWINTLKSGDLGSMQYGYIMVAKCLLIWPDCVALAEW
jgi:hypothetical protein